MTCSFLEDTFWPIEAGSTLGDELCSLANGNIQEVEFRSLEGLG